MDKTEIAKLLDAVTFDAQGLVCAVIQDHRSNQVLMQAYMNREALARTLATGKVHFYSRSRKKLWLKGEESGHIQQVRELRIDCDGDCLLILVDQAGGACHEGYRSCFFRRNQQGAWAVVDPKVFDPKQVYRRGG